MPDQSAYLRAAVDIGHLGARVEDEGALLEAVADLLLRSFDLVAVQVYLMDASGLFGELRHHVGAGDRKTIARTPGVPVGPGSGLGEALAGGEPQELRDMRTLPRSAVPPDGRHGMALPLNVEGQVLGALVLYGSGEDAFVKSDATPFVALTDMLALALENVRTRAKLRRETAQPRGRGAVLREMRAALALDKPLDYSYGGQGDAEGEGHTAPITLRGSVIGSMTFRGPEEKALDADEVELIESVADQVAQAIENLELLEGAQRVAQREQLINEITAQLQRATSVDEVLRTAAQAVRVALGDVEVTARLSPEAVASVAQAESPAGGG